MPRSILLALAIFAFPLAASAGKPNVLIVMTDDQGLGDFSYTGNPVLKPRDVKAPAQNTDLLPTLCELCGVAPPGRDKADEQFAGIRAGKTKLKAWFADAGAKDLCAAFYVTVKRKG